MTPTPSTVATADAAAYDPTQKQKSQAKTSRIPIKIVPAERLKKAGMDPRARAFVTALRRDQKDPARAQPAHRL